jgi:hypothetical protein
VALRRNERTLPNSTPITFRLPGFNRNMKSPDGQSGLLGLSFDSGYSRRLPVPVLTAAESLTGAWRRFHSPLGAGSCALPAIAGPGVWEAETRFDPDIGYESALCVAINRLAVNLQQPFEVFGRQHIRQRLEVASIGALWSMARLRRSYFCPGFHNCFS